MSRSSASVLVGTLLTAVVMAGCDKVPLLAPTNSTIRLNAAVGTVATNGSVEITAVVIESAGTPVQNGTVVTFSSSLGTVEPREGRTSNGQVTVQYRSGTQSGKAVISAFSGGTKSDDLEILVGGAAAGAVTLRADTTVLPSTGGTTALYATVFDTGGNPLRGVSVSFSATAGQLTVGAAFTDDAGQARTELFTTRESTVTARVSGVPAPSSGSGGSGGGTTTTSADLKIEVRDAPVIDLAGGTKSAGDAVTWEVGIPLPFKLTPKTTANAIRSAVVNFGDGQTRSLGQLLSATSVSHTYGQLGIYTTTVTATDVLNFVGSTSIDVTIIPKRTIALSVTATPSLTGQIATLNANPQPSVAADLPAIVIQQYEWDFGDGSTEVTTGPTVSHRFSSAGTAYNVRVRAVSTQGHEGFGQVIVRF